eukprot:761845-Hanusia_phi.AAC.1
MRRRSFSAARASAAFLALSSRRSNTPPACSLLQQPTSSEERYGIGHAGMARAERTGRAAASSPRAEEEQATRTVSLPYSLEVRGDGVVLQVGAEVPDPEPPVRRREAAADVGEEQDVPAGPGGLEEVEAGQTAGAEVVLARRERKDEGLDREESCLRAELDARKREEGVGRGAQERR